MRRGGCEANMEGGRQQREGLTRVAKLFKMPLKIQEYCGVNTMDSGGLMTLWPLVHVL